MTPPFCTATFLRLYDALIAAATTFGAHPQAVGRGTFTLRPAPLSAASHLHTSVQPVSAHGDLRAQADKAILATALEDLAAFMQAHPCALFHPRQTFYCSIGNRGQALAVRLNGHRITDYESPLQSRAHLEKLALQSAHLPTPTGRVFMARSSAKQEHLYAAASPAAAAALHTLLVQFTAKRNKTALPEVHEVCDTPTLAEDYHAYIAAAHAAVPKPSRKRARA